MERYLWYKLCFGLLICLVLLLGFNLKITVIKALIAGFFGVPGALAVILYELFV